MYNDNIELIVKAQIAITNLLGRFKDTAQIEIQDILIFLANLKRLEELDN